MQLLQCIRASFNIHMVLLLLLLLLLLLQLLPRG
jgi:hypothetical protein